MWGAWVSGFRFPLISLRAHGLSRAPYFGRMGSPLPSPWNVTVFFLIFLFNLFLRQLQKLLTMFVSLVCLPNLTGYLAQISLSLAQLCQKQSYHTAFESPNVFNFIQYDLSTCPLKFSYSSSVLAKIVTICNSEQRKHKFESRPRVYTEVSSCFKVYFHFYPYFVYLRLSYH